MESSLIATIAPANLIIIAAVTVLAALLGFALYRVAEGSLSGAAAGKDSRSLIEPLDVRAFNNLIDPAEEDFLRAELRGAVFRDLQRLRLRAAAEYVSCASRNAGALIRMGRAISPAIGEEYSQKAHEMVTAAVQLRFLSLLVLCLLWVKIAFPGLRLSLKEVSALHERLVMQQASLARFHSSERLLSNS